MHALTVAALAATSPAAVFAGGETCSSCDAADKSPELAKSAAASLRQAVAQIRGDDVHALRDAVTRAATQLKGWRAGRELKSALDLTANVRADIAATILRGVAGRVAADLEFSPLSEAEVPVGWPAYTPVGEVAVREYPVYRAARTTKGMFAGNGRFWALFRHIERHEIPMTAPVEMTLEVSADGKPMASERSMAFLYPSTATGKTGDEGNVEIVDIPAATAVSIGVRGKISQARIARAQEALDTWLKANADRYARAGDLRVLGYNSPMVPDAQSYFEVQVPVTKK
jgi:hypothetical protein